MTYNAEQARADLNARAKAQEFERNMLLIQATSQGGGRWVQVHHGYNGAQTMADKLKALGYSAEVTHSGLGVKASW
jgi:hypothetical protein